MPSFNFFYQIILKATNTLSKSSVYKIVISLGPEAVSCSISSVAQVYLCVQCFFSVGHSHHPNCLLAPATSMLQTTTTVEMDVESRYPLQSSCLHRKLLPLAGTSLSHQDTQWCSHLMAFVKVTPMPWCIIISFNVSSNPLLLKCEFN